MCEIVVLDPERIDNKSIHQLGAQLLDEQGDGLGILSIQTDGEKFNYSVYRHTKPSWWKLEQFLRKTSKHTWRYVIHGRASTGGGVKRDHAHPLPIDCPECDAEWVVHNGSVRNHQQNRASLTKVGHEFVTDVDSEVIPHKITELPESVEDHDDSTYKISGNLNYLVFFEDGILTKFSRKYHVTDDFVVACRTRKRKEPLEEVFGDMDNDSEWLLVTPDKEIERKERSVKTTYGNAYGGSGKSRSTSPSQGTTGGSSNTSTYTNIDTNAENGEEDAIMEVYDELVPNIPGISAYRVAPGVIKVVDIHSDDEEYVFRRDEPGLYHYYATDEEPDEKQVGLEVLFDGDGNLRDADEIVEESGGSINFHELAEMVGADAKAAEAAEDVAQATVDAIAERETAQEVGLAPSQVETVFRALEDRTGDKEEARELFHQLETSTLKKIATDPKKAFDDGLAEEALPADPDAEVAKERHKQEVAGDDFLSEEEYDLAFSTLLEKYGSESTALSKLEKMSKEGIQTLAANPDIAQTETTTATTR